jgi:hypothetical protein
LFDFHRNLVEPGHAAFRAVLIASEVAFQLRNTIAGGLKLLCLPLRGIYGLPGILIGGICRLVQKIQDRLPGLIDELDVLRIIEGVHAVA